MENFSIVIFIMAILIALAAFSERSKFPYPILLVIAGLIVGFVPALPDLAMDSRVVFLIFLPPLLYDAASKTSWHELRVLIRPISALAISLVFFTTFAVAVSAHYLIPGFTWPLSFVLGAIVSPPDAASATSITKGLGLNKKEITILEGESLLNDASALIAYRYAIAAVSSGTFIFWQAGMQFLLVAGMGILIGIVSGYLFVFVHKKIKNNAIIETSLTLLSPYVAYLFAENFHISGILAVVSAGLIISWRAPEIFSYDVRMRTRVVWDTLIFLLNGFIFILIGLQLPSIIKNLDDYPFIELLLDGLLISVVTIVVRFIWVFAGAYWQNILRKKKVAAIADDNGNDSDTWKNVLIVAWTGTRGIISLAMALALPLIFENGNAFPKRHSIIFLAFIAIFVTLVVQGLSLPLLVRLLRVKAHNPEGNEEKELKLYLASSTLHFIEHEFPISLESTLKKQLKVKYETLTNNLTKEMHDNKKRQEKDEAIQVSVHPLLSAQLEVSRFQRHLLVKLHKEGAFSDAVLKKVELERDVDDLKLDIQLPKEEE